MTVIAVLMLVMLIFEVWGFLFTSGYQRAFVDLRNDTREVRILQQALTDQKGSAADFVRSGDASELQNYFEALGLVNVHRAALQRVDRRVSAARGRSTVALAERLETIWESSIDLARRGRPREAQSLLDSAGERALLAALRREIDQYLNVRNAAGDVYQDRAALGTGLLLGLKLLGGALTSLFLVVAFRAGTREARGRGKAMREAVAAHHKVKKLFEMADILQCASGYDDATAALAATAQGLLPRFAGCLYIFNHSGDRLDLAASWNHKPGELPPEAVAPSMCWALKRGKPHLNGGSSTALRCSHDTSDSFSLEIPMMARGEVYGLLAFAAPDHEGQAELEESRPVIAALADATSLALSNIALREKLRSQALRDPLTGLYNRRYMEDMLQRFVLLSDRTGAPVSAIMIDLDHFKRLNDKEGHLVGDAVLRSVASTIAGALRESDVACRYGGEELIVLMPDCSLESALAKAETLRSRIEALTDVHGVPVTASLGVATRPTTSAGSNDLLSMSDAALYKAKRGGRNRVEAAPGRGEEAELPLAAE